MVRERHLLGVTAARLASVAVARAEITGTQVMDFARDNAGHANGTATGHGAASYAHTIGERDVTAAQDVAFIGAAPMTGEPHGS